MAPRRKSQADSTAAVATAVSLAASEKGDVTAATLDDEVMTAVEGDTSVAARSAVPAKAAIFATKQQKDAASGADGIDQYELARTQVTKVSKSAIPDNIQLRKEVILGLIKSSTIFINYLASAALDKTHEAGNKTLSATHVINAFKEMGFPEEYAEQLKKEYNDKVKMEADRAKATKAAKADADAAKADEENMEVEVENSRDEAAVEANTAEDESMAVDLSKEDEDEEEEEEDKEVDDGDAEEEDDPEGEMEAEVEDGNDEEEEGEEEEVED